MTFLKTSWGDRIRLERALAKALHHCGGPVIEDLTFRKQSHNAVVFRGVLEGAPVFVKQYETDYGPVLTRNTIEETGIVSAQMADAQDGVVKVVWASVDSGIIVTSQADGVPFVDILSTPEQGYALRDAARWFRAYVGPRMSEDRFSTSYWFKQRSATDVSALRDSDRKIVTEILALQQARVKIVGTVSAVKGRVPKDFAPHNLHWTGDAIFGFDLEGYSRQPIVKTAMWFVILASIRVGWTDDLIFGLPAECVIPFMDALQDQANSPELWPYLAADLMFERFVHRYADKSVRVQLRQGLLSHLKTA